MSKVIGIDLGTTNSVVSIWDGTQPTVINTAEGSRTLPSIVSFNKSGEKFVGVTAKRQAITNPENTIFSVKRFMGHTYKEVEEQSKSLPYKVEKGKKNMAVIHLPAINKSLTPEEISAMILQKLKTDAEAYLGEKVTKAVITVPAYFTDSQRQATKDAGEIAGLEVIRIINEPTAAALAYGLEKNIDENILVFDLGGGTFDVSVLEVGDGTFEVKSSSGDAYLGGDDFDNKIIDWIITEYKQSMGIDLSKDSAAMQRLKEAAEKAKCELSSQTSVNINLPYITSFDNNPAHLDMNLTRSKFENMCSDLLERIKKPVLTAIKDSKLDISNINQVVLVGGSTRIPMVQELIKNLSGKEPVKNINPDEAVALGASIQAGILTGSVKDIILLDVTPLSLGVEVNGGLVDFLIEKNTTIPFKKSNVYTTAADNQTDVDIHILQGERKLASENKSLGRFQLGGIAPAPAHVPQIEVEFEIDANGILNVTAKDKATGKSQNITITGSGSLSKEEIEKMIKDAEENAQKDQETKELIEMKNTAENVCYASEKFINENKEKVSEEDSENIFKLIESVRSSIKTDDKTEINNSLEELNKANGKLAEVLYSQPKEEAVSVGQD